MALLPLFRRPSNEDSSSGDHHKLSFREIILSYGPDWTLAVFLWVTLSWLNRQAGHQREFSLDGDISIQHTFAVHERVPPLLLLLISLILPLVSVILLSTLVMRNAWDIHNSVLSVLMSWTVAGWVTQVIKLAVGRPRPDFIDRCQPLPGSHDAHPYGLSNASICTQTNAYILADGHKSFPSGHSSLTFAGLGLLSFYLAGKLHLFSVRGHKSRAWLAFAPLLGGVMVAVSRTMDNRHHWTDVTVGSILGLTIAYITYRGYYPPLSHPRSHLPYAPREAVEDHPLYPVRTGGEGYLPVARDGEDVVPRPSGDYETEE